MAEDAQDKDATSAIPLLSQRQLDALDAACEMHSGKVRRTLQGARPDEAFVDDQARLAGFKHLQAASADYKIHDRL